MVEHSLNGNKNKFALKCFKIEAWHDKAKRFNELTQLNYSVVHLENRLHCYKQEFKTVTRMLADDGFSWVPAEKRVKASEEHWRKLV